MKPEAMDIEDWAKSGSTTGTLDASGPKAGWFSNHVNHTALWASKFPRAALEAAWKVLRLRRQLATRGPRLAAAAGRPPPPERAAPGAMKAAARRRSSSKAQAPATPARCRRGRGRLAGRRVVEEVEDAAARWRHTSSKERSTDGSRGSTDSGSSSTERRTTRWGLRSPLNSAR